MCPSVCVCVCVVFAPKMYANSERYHLIVTLAHKSVGRCALMLRLKKKREAFDQIFSTSEELSRDELNGLADVLLRRRQMTHTHSRRSDQDISEESH